MAHHGIQKKKIFSEVKLGLDNGQLGLEHGDVGRN